MDLKQRKEVWGGCVNGHRDCRGDDAVAVWHQTRRRGQARSAASTRTIGHDGLAIANARRLPLSFRTSSHAQIMLKVHGAAGGGRTGRGGGALASGSLAVGGRCEAKNVGSKQAKCSPVRYEGCRLR